jgi:hypothetical protein
MEEYLLVKSGELLPLNLHDIGTLLLAGGISPTTNTTGVVSLTGWV